MQSKTANKSIQRTVKSGVSLRYTLLLTAADAGDIDGALIFQKDYLFSSPSGASTITLGRSSNGWIEWKNKKGETLKALEQA
ncbi:MAG: DUF4357 domain-containing protein [Mariprofundaceae bacterium]|nr:DUF4357 domain-containing protein [Mariprofundaceae bacterium]